MRLVECSACGLCWMDAQLPAKLVAEHFSRAYKDEAYFARSRRLIFQRLAATVGAAAPEYGAVLDIGGAKGHLLAEVRRLRPTLRLLLNDISEISTRRGTELFGLEAVAGDLEVLARLNRRFDVVVLSDVLYYVPNLRRVWEILVGLLTPGGTLVLRVPNRAWLIVAVQAARRQLGVGPRDRIPGFNAEHVYLFKRGYLRRRLISLGFETVTVAASPPLTGGLDLAAHALSLAADAVEAISGGRVICSSSIIVTAWRRVETSGECPE